MANRFIGEVQARAGDREFTLRMDFNAMAHFEDATGRNAMKTFEEAEGGAASVSILRQIVHSALQRHHPDADLAAAGDILSEDSEVLAALFTAAAPKAAPAGKAKPVRKAG